MKKELSYAEYHMLEEKLRKCRVVNQWMRTFLLTNFPEAYERMTAVMQEDGRDPEKDLKEWRGEQ